MEELPEARVVASRPDWTDELIACPEARRPYPPDYKGRKGRGSHRVEPWNDRAVSGRYKGRGMSSTAKGLVAPAVLESTRRNGEVETPGAATAGCPG